MTAPRSRKSVVRRWCDVIIGDNCQRTQEVFQNTPDFPHRQNIRLPHLIVDARLTFNLRPSVPFVLSPFVHQCPWVCASQCALLPSASFWPFCCYLSQYSLQQHRHLATLHPLRQLNHLVALRPQTPHYRSMSLSHLRRAQLQPPQ